VDGKASPMKKCLIWLFTITMKKKPAKVTCEKCAKKLVLIKNYYPVIKETDYFQIVTTSLSNNLKNAKWKQQYLEQLNFQK
jgi:hypothetical protein